MSYLLSMSIDLSPTKLAQALIFALPFVLAGLIHIIVIKNNLLQSLADLPLDCGLKLRGQRVFGKNKTVRGALTMIVGVTFCILIQATIVHYFPSTAKFAVINYNHISPLIWGLLLGIGCVVGELPNSFIKRQLKIAPGNQTTGIFKPFFWVIDQVDSLIGVLIFAGILWKPTYDMLILLFLYTIIIHPIGALIMVSLGLKRSI